MRDRNCVDFLQSVLPRMRMRWSGFRKVRRQVCKRLSRRLQELGLEDLAAYRAHLEAHPEEWKRLDELCRITVSRFFRDRRVFEVLHQHCLPDLARMVRPRGEPMIRCWSAGCASGEEPYSLNLAWQMGPSRRMPGVDVHIVATDTDSRLLERSRRACYPPGSLKELPAEWVQEAFVPKGEELCLRQAFRRSVRIVQQDIRERMPPGHFELLLCRNLVFTYFEPSLQEELLRRMLERIADGGFLVLGGHEAVPPGEWPLERPHGSLPIYRHHTP